MIRPISFKYFSEGKAEAEGSSVKVHVFHLFAIAAEIIIQSPVAEHRQSLRQTPGPHPSSPTHRRFRLGTLKDMTQSPEISPW
jgi:hypothetical protein